MSEDRLERRVLGLEEADKCRREQLDHVVELVEKLEQRPQPYADFDARLDALKAWSEMRDKHRSGELDRHWDSIVDLDKRVKELEEEEDREDHTDFLRFREMTQQGLRKLEDRFDTVNRNFKRIEEVLEQHTSTIKTIVDTIASRADVRRPVTQDEIRGSRHADSNNWMQVLEHQAKLAAENKRYREAILAALKLWGPPIMVNGADYERLEPLMDRVTETCTLLREAVSGG